MQDINVPYKLFNYNDLFDPATGDALSTMPHNLGFPYAETDEVKVRVFEWDLHEDGTIDDTKIDVVHTAQEYAFPKNDDDDGYTLIDSSSSRESIFDTSTLIFRSFRFNVDPATGNRLTPKNGFGALRLLFYRDTPDNQLTNFRMTDFANSDSVEKSLDKIIRLIQELKDHPLSYLIAQEESDERTTPDISKLDDLIDGLRTDLGTRSGDDAFTQLSSHESRLDTVEGETDANTTNVETNTRDISTNRDNIDTNRQAIQRAAPTGEIDAPHVRGAWSAIDTSLDVITNESRPAAEQDALNLWAARQLRAAIDRLIARYRAAEYPDGTRAELEAGTETDQRTWSPEALKTAIDNLRELAYPVATAQDIVDGRETGLRAYSPQIIQRAMQTLIHTFGGGGGGGGGAVTSAAVRAAFSSLDPAALLAAGTDTDLNLFTALALNDWLNAAVNPVSTVANNAQALATTNQGNIATNTGNIATNTQDIARLGQVIMLFVNSHPAQFQNVYDFLGITEAVYNAAAANTLYNFAVEFQFPDPNIRRDAARNPLNTFTEVFDAITNFNTDNAATSPTSHGAVVRLVFSGVNINLVPTGQTLTPGVPIQTLTFNVIHRAISNIVDNVNAEIRTNGFDNREMQFWAGATGAGGMPRARANLNFNPSNPRLELPDPGTVAEITGAMNPSSLASWSAQVLRQAIDARVEAGQVGTTLSRDAHLISGRTTGRSSAPKFLTPLPGTATEGRIGVSVGGATPLVFSDGENTHSLDSVQRFDVSFTNMLTLMGSYATNGITNSLARGVDGRRVGDIDYVLGSTLTFSNMTSSQYGAFNAPVGSSYIMGTAGTTREFFMATVIRNDTRTRTMEFSLDRGGYYLGIIDKLTDRISLGTTLHRYFTAWLFVSPDGTRTASALSPIIASSLPAYSAADGAANRYWKNPAGKWWRADAATSSWIETNDVLLGDAAFESAAVPPATSATVNVIGYRHADFLREAENFNKLVWELLPGNTEYRCVNGGRVNVFGDWVTVPKGTVISVPDLRGVANQPLISDGTSRVVYFYITRSGVIRGRLHNPTITPIGRKDPYENDRCILEGIVQNNRGTHTFVQAGNYFPYQKYHDTEMIPLTNTIEATTLSGSTRIDQHDYPVAPTGVRVAPNADYGGLRRTGGTRTGVTFPEGYYSTRPAVAMQLVDAGRNSALWEVDSSSEVLAVASYEYNGGYNDINAGVTGLNRAHPFTVTRQGDDARQTRLYNRYKG